MICSDREMYMCSGDIKNNFTLRSERFVRSFSIAHWAPLEFPRGLQNTKTQTAQTAAHHNTGKVLITWQCWQVQKAQFVCQFYICFATRVCLCALKLKTLVNTSTPCLFSSCFGPRPNVCLEREMTLVAQRQPCVQAFTRMVKVWKQGCVGQSWCMGYERRWVTRRVTVALLMSHKRRIYPKGPHH